MYSLSNGAIFSDLERRTPNPNVKVTPLFKAECLINGIRHTDFSFNEILLEIVIRMTLSYLERFSNIINDTKHRPVSATAELFVRQH